MERNRTKWEGMEQNGRNDIFLAGVRRNGKEWERLERNGIK